MKIYKAMQSVQPAIECSGGDSSNGILEMNGKRRREGGSVIQAAVFGRVQWAVASNYLNTLCMAVMGRSSWRTVTCTFQLDVLNCMGQAPHMSYCLDIYNLKSLACQRSVRMP